MKKLKEKEIEELAEIVVRSILEKENKVEEIKDDEKYIVRIRDIRDRFENQYGEKVNSYENKYWNEEYGWQLSESGSSKFTLSEIENHEVLKDYVGLVVSLSELEHEHEMMSR